MRISVNLATRPFANLGPIVKRLRIAMGALALIAVVLGIGLHLLDRKAEQARDRMRAVDSKVSVISHERQGYQAMMLEPLNAATLAQADTLNALFDEKAFSWTLAMEDLETVLPGGVQVTTLEPIRDKDGHITLRLRVIGPRDRGIELVSNLEHSRRFLRPRIVGESAESTGGPNEHLEPVSATNRENFELLADYNPAKPGERRAVKHPADNDATPAPPLRTLPPTPPGANRPPYTGMPRPTSHGQRPAGGVQ